LISGEETAPLIIGAAIFWSDGCHPVTGGGLFFDEAVWHDPLIGHREKHYVGVLECAVDLADESAPFDFRSKSNRPFRVWRRFKSQSDYSISTRMQMMIISATFSIVDIINES
jgi:hypothetical protein